MTLPLISDPTQFDHVQSNASGTTVASSSKTWTSGRLYLVFTGGSGVTARTASSVAGASGTWTKFPISDSSYNESTNWAVAGFFSTNATGTGALTTTFSGSWGTNRFIHTFEIVAGFDTSGLAVQTRNANVVGSADLTISTFVTPTSLHNLIIGYYAHRSNETLAALNGGTLVGQQVQAGPPSLSKSLWFKRGDASSTAKPSWDGSSANGGVATGIEVKAAKIAAVANRRSVSGNRVLLDGVRL